MLEFIERHNPGVSEAVAYGSHPSFQVRWSTLERPTVPMSLCKKEAAHFFPLQNVPIAFTPPVSHVALLKGLHFAVSCWHMNTLLSQCGHVLKNENQN